MKVLLDNPLFPWLVVVGIVCLILIIVLKLEVSQNHRLKERNASLRRQVVTARNALTESKNPGRPQSIAVPSSPRPLRKPLSRTPVHLPASEDDTPTHEMTELHDLVDLLERPSPCPNCQSREIREMVWTVPASLEEDTDLVHVECVGCGASRSRV